RPEGYVAAALIEECGLKGCSVGGAQVSDKHSGFVINKDNASYEDIIQLVKHIKKTVYEKKGVELQCEMLILGGGEPHISD
ncbi:MAG: UDP-N-acetylenolpyruvoylglucosamine reductase, partial [Oscillospiraceae bacterium]|nr:UDP-N-acetylenolpyruvoylglucosamine reductase [Oscillospiraceae bacterium]